MQPFVTHHVSNQVVPLEDYSLFDTDTALREAVMRGGGQAWAAELAEHGAWLGRSQTIAAGVDANRHGPVLHAYDRTGHRIDQLEFHPAWAALMHGAMVRGLHCRPWAQAVPGAHVARAAGFFMQGQIEAGSLCPLTMTHAAIPLLMHEPAGQIDFGHDWLPRLLHRGFDGADAPLHTKRSALLGMGLTEKQGGSDLRAITTEAKAIGKPGRGQAYRLLGHKWFFSVPQADAHLVLARSDEGISCFFLPRWVPDGPRNALRVRRLKDKLGNRSNASAEVEFEDAWAVMLGEPGKGLAVLLEMAATTRLDCVLGSAALLRQGVAQALHHIEQRHAFGRPLRDQPAMRQVAADLALESEAALLLGLRLAQAMDRRDDHATERLLLRVLTPASKLWVCKRAITALGEAMEVLGGNGYVEEGPLARLYREAPVNSIWEGSGNVMALDVLRGLGRDAASVAAVAAEFDLARGIDSRFDQAADAWLAAAAQAGEGAARAVAAGLARLMQAALLLRHAPAPLGAAFLASRFAPAGLYGECVPEDAIEAVLARAWPAIC